MENIEFWHNMLTLRIDSIASLTEEQLKLQGDRLFKAGKYDEAVKSYSGALCKNPRNYKHLMDRAMCYEKLNQWEMFLMDYRRAMDIKANMLYTAGLMYGAGVLDADDLDEASKYLDSARDITRRQTELNSKEFVFMLERSRKRRWNNLEAQDIDREKNLLIYMNYLLRAEKKKSLSQLRKNKKKLTAEQVVAKREEIKHESADRSKELCKLFDKLKGRRKDRLVPDYLFCPITYEMFTDPVITPSGITYERKSIEKHLRKCGYFDPISRSHLTVDMLVPNRAILNAAEAFLANNEWARYE